MPNRLRIGAVIAIAVSAAGFASVMGPGPRAEPGDNSAVVDVFYAQPAEKIETHVLRRGETLSDVLARSQITGLEQHDLLFALMQFVNPRRLNASTEVTVPSYNIYFDPKELTIPADTDVTVSLPNVGAILHNFSIDDLGIDVDIDPGATEETTINAPAGEYEYYCNVPGHTAAGMVGTLTVQ